LEKVLIR